MVREMMGITEDQILGIDLSKNSHFVESDKAAVMFTHYERPVRHNVLLVSVHLKGDALGIVTGKVDFSMCRGRRPVTYCFNHMARSVENMGYTVSDDQQQAVWQLTEFIADLYSEAIGYWKRVPHPVDVVEFSGFFS